MSGHRTSLSTRLRRDENALAAPQAIDNAFRAGGYKLSQSEPSRHYTLPEITAVVSNVIVLPKMKIPFT